MNSTIYAPIRQAKKFIISNSRLFLICALVVLLGFALGAYLVTSELAEDIVYAFSIAEISDVIIGEYSFLGLVLSNLKTLIVPMLIIFLMLTNRFTGVLSFFYLGYQGLLLGASVVSVLSDFGIGGVLVVLFLLLPMNLANFMVLISWLIVNYKRMQVARTQRLKLLYSLRVFFKPIIGVVVAGIIASIIYGVLYPMLLRSAVVVIV